MSESDEISFDDFPTHLEVADGLSRLMIRLTDYLAENPRLREEDVRRQTVGGLNSACFGVSIPIRIACRAATNEEARSCLEPALLMREGSLRDPEVLRSLLNDPRLTILISWQFIMEALLRSLHPILCTTPLPWSWKDLADETMTGAFPGGPDLRRSVLEVPQLMRNCLHNGGIFLGRDFDAEIGGRTFSFRRGEMPSCVTWPNLLVVFDRGLTVCFELFEVIRDHGFVRRIGA